MPRDPKRIKEILTELERVWNDNPDLRFGQLISNLFENIHGASLFYTEDDKFLNALRSKCKDCGISTFPGPGSARCPQCWEDRCDH